MAVIVAVNVASRQVRAGVRQRRVMVFSGGLFVAGALPPARTVAAFDRARILPSGDDHAARRHALRVSGMLGAPAPLRSSADVPEP